MPPPCFQRPCRSISWVGAPFWAMRVGGVLDARQVKAVAVALRELDRSGELRRYLRAPSEMPARVISEEGLILGMQDPQGFQAAANRALIC